MGEFEKIVLVTRKTRLAELLHRDRTESATDRAQPGPDVHFPDKRPGSHTGPGRTGLDVFGVPDGLRCRGIRRRTSDESDAVGLGRPGLLFVVREPFVSRHSQANIVAGLVEPQQRLELESLMPSGGVIFSDGVEADYLSFDSGTNVTVGAAAETARLVVA